MEAIFLTLGLSHLPNTWQEQEKNLDFLSLLQYQSQRMTV